MTLRRRVVPALCGLLILLSGSPARANCANPVGVEAAVMYNTDYKVMQFCNGTQWISMAGATAVTGSNPATPPAGTGYFVLTNTTYNGNLGGLSGGSAKCLTELTTNTNWRGYSTANANGQLVSAKVKAFLCTTLACNDAMPLATYNFARVGSATDGGATFTADSNGKGPGNSVNWAAANYFGIAAYFWTGRAYSDATNWGVTYSGGSVSCDGWTNSTAVYGGSNRSGYTSSSNAGRYEMISGADCSGMQRLVCIVDP